jgi:hypothetical protein
LVEDARVREGVIHRAWNGPLTCRQGGLVFIAMTKMRHLKSYEAKGRPEGYKPHRIGLGKILHAFQSSEALKRTKKLYKDNNIPFLAQSTTLPTVQRSTSITLYNTTPIASRNYDKLVASAKLRLPAAASTMWQVVQD